MTATRVARAKATDEELAALRETRPDDQVELPEGHVPCRICGVATAPVGGAERVPLPPPTYADGRVTPTASADRSVLVTRCDTCLDRLTRALRVTADHPALVGKLGGHRAVEVAEGLLAALALLDHLEALPEDISDARLGILVRNVGTAGRAVQWSANPSVGTCSPHPFAHVRPGTRGDLRVRYAAALRERLALGSPPVRVPPPAPSRGCMLCGVAAVELSAAQAARLRADGVDPAARVWHPMSGTPEGLGGKRAPGALIGHVCPDCNEARTSVASVGPTLRERAYLNHLRRTGQHDEAERLAGAFTGPVPPTPRAWCVTSEPPSDEPWVHLARTR